MSGGRRLAFSSVGGDACARIREEAQHVGGDAAVVGLVEAVEHDEDQVKAGQ